jgi:hypothetical protein
MEYDPSIDSHELKISYKSGKYLSIKNLICSHRALLGVISGSTGMGLPEGWMWRSTSP